MSRDIYRQLIAAIDLGVREELAAAGAGGDLELTLAVASVFAARGESIPEPLERRLAGAGPRPVPGRSGPVAVGQRFEELVGCLLRSRGDLDELVGAALQLRWLALVELDDADRALVDRAASYVRARALLAPRAQFHLEIARRSRSGAPTTPATDRRERPPGDARTRARNAARWIDEHLGELQVSREPERYLLTLKAIAEMAHAGEILTRLIDGDLSSTGERWLAHAWEAVSGADLAALIRRAPRNALVATILPPFYRAGRDIDSARDAVAGQLPRAFLSGREWAYLCPALESIAIAPPAAGARAAAAASMLERRPDPWTLDVDDTYQLTHEVFYATAWGEDRSRLGSTERAWMLRWLPCWIEHHASLGDTDLVAELLAVELIASGRGFPVGWTLLANAQQPDGSVTPPRERPIASNGFATAFGSRYHPTLVAIMAWALAG